MAFLVDTNILLRLAQTQHPLHTLVSDAVRDLTAKGHEGVICSQNLVEFWNAATRPADRNGFGLTPERAWAEVERLERLFRVLPDDPGVHAEWKLLARSARVSGVQVHDARLVAMMQFHGVDQILTLNASDFKRFPGITPLHPQQAVTGNTAPGAPGDRSDLEG